MKQSIRVLIIAIAFVLTACGGMKIKYFTRINSDGSVFKRVTAIGDSSDIYANSFTFDVNDGWRVRYDTEIDTIKGDTLYVAIAEKTFKSAQDAHQGLYRTNDTLSRENIRINHERKFRWFYTFNTYKETFEQYFTFRHVSIKEFMTEQELDYFLKEDSSLVQGMKKKDIKRFESEIEEKFEEFVLTSVYIEFVRILDVYANENNYPLSYEEKQNIQKIMIVGFDDFPKLDELCFDVDSIVGHSWVSKAYNEHLFDEFEQICDNRLFYFMDDDYVVEIEVPGLLYETNALSINGNKLHWEFDCNQFQFTDCELVAKYRITNIWAFVLTGLIILALIVWLFRRKK